MRGHQDRVNRVSQENVQQQLPAIVEHRVDKLLIEGRGRGNDVRYWGRHAAREGSFCRVGPGNPDSCDAIIYRHPAVHVIRRWRLRALSGKSRKNGFDPVRNI